jgi:cell wall-associated NlpC family hydrolase
VLAALCCELGACAARRVGPAPAGTEVPATAAAPAEPGSEQATRAGRFVGAAVAMLGAPYRYGGSTPDRGFDCSGLVAYAAGSIGVWVPRTALEQLHEGQAVARANLRAGDLVFMHLAAKELHVGIAIDPGRFVHAPSTGGRVRIDSLNARPYAEGFFAARRIMLTP